jgi:flagellin
MSSIVLSASVRQNLLSLQSTADLLSTTQSRLATGKKVNTALDNPTNFFTAASLDSRASDINNLLDGIGNGVQVLQAANTGISSLQKLVDSAKSVANQALQTQVGYSTKSTVSTAAIAGATASNLLGTAAAATDATFTGTAANNNLTAPGLINVNTELATAANSDSLTAGFANGDTITVNGTVVTFVASGATGNQLNVTDEIGDLLAKIDSITGGTGSTVNGTGQVVLHTGTTSDLSITSSNAGALTALGLSGGVTQARTPGVTPLGGLTLTIGATGGGTATSITFGSSSGQVDTLDELNAALVSNNLLAALTSAGAITIGTSNDAASSTIGALGGTAAGSGNPFNNLAILAPVQDADAQLVRSNLVGQYNKIMEQVVTTAQDASFNGINLLNGDTLKLVFNETATSTLSVTGVTFDPAGLGLATLAKGTDFIDNNATNKVVGALNNATVTLRSLASALGSNLSVVQARQDFSRNMIIVLQTGSNNLTLADTNEEAANSQALSTRQSIAVSALALANQSQQSVLQLLR